MYAENLLMSACSWTNMEGFAYASMKLFGRYVGTFSLLHVLITTYTLLKWVFENNRDTFS